MPLDNDLAQLVPPDWHFLLVGDGSGNLWSNPCGWASVLIASDGSRSVWHGAANMGSNNFAEAMAYFAPLMWLSSQHKQLAPNDVWTIRVITDSQYLADVGKREESGVGAMWRAMEMLQREGLLVYWKWINRDSLDLNKFVDRVSRESRLGWTELLRDPQRPMVKYEEQAVDINPNTLETLDLRTSAG